jgi:serine/threonine-protein kinase HipA
MHSCLDVPRTDFSELFRRILLFIALNNCDDHSKNHGFCRIGGRWRLAPMFDVVPEYRTGITGTPLRSGEASDRTLDALMHMHQDFGITLDQAKQSCAAVAHGLSRWRQLAAELAIDDVDDTVFPDRFENARTELEHLSR